MGVGWGGGQEILENTVCTHYEQNAELSASLQLQSEVI